MSRSKPYLLILVHGTFATNAPWTAEESLFRQQMRAKLGDNIRFAVFNWSGKNSHGARKAASAKLVEFLNDLCGDTEREKIIISHSHGGNVAMYALRDLGEQSVEFSLVTLATPFLEVEKRDYQWYLSLNIFIVPLLICSLLLAAAAFIFTYYFKSGGTVPVVIVLAGCCLLFPWIHRMLQPFKNKIIARVNAIDEEYSFHARPVYSRMLTIVDTKDEIKLWFTLLYNLWKGITWLQRMVFNYGLGFLVFIIAYVVISQAYNLFFNPLVNESVTVSVLEHESLILISCLAIILLTVLIVFVSRLLFFFLKSNTLALGKESAYMQLFFNIRPLVSSPHGYRVTFYQHSGSSQLLSLRHSIYNDVFVVQVIADWVLKGRGWEMKSYKTRKRKISEIRSSVDWDTIMVSNLIKIFVLAGLTDRIRWILRRDLRYNDFEKIEKEINGISQSDPNKLSKEVSRKYLFEAVSLLLDIGGKEEAFKVISMLGGKSEYEAEQYINEIEFLNNDYYAEKEERVKLIRKEERNEKLIFFGMLVVLAGFPFVIIEAGLGLFDSRHSWVATLVHNNFFDEVRDFTSDKKEFVSNMSNFLFSLLLLYTFKILITVVFFITGKQFRINIGKKIILVTTGIYALLFLAELVIFGAAFGYHPLDQYLILSRYFSLPSLLIGGTLIQYFNDRKQ